METTNYVLDRILSDFELPHIEERLPRELFYRLGLRFPQQYGIACRDVAACVRRAEALGAGPFVHGTVAIPNWIENGERRDCRLEVGAGYAGDMQIEFLGPGQGTDHYARAIQDREIAFHHVGVFQVGMTKLAESTTNAGYPLVVRGGISIGKALSVDFRYFDSRPDYGVYLEIVDMNCFGKEIPLGALIRAYSAAARAARKLTS